MNNTTEENMVEKLRNDPYVKGYITGFFDAEGCVQISGDGILEAFTTQAYLPVLERIDSVFKGHIGVHSKEGYDKRGVHRRGAWRHRLTSDDAIPFLEYIYSYSIEKRKQIELAIRYQKEEKQTHAISQRRKGLAQTEIEKRNWFMNELKRLKHEQCDEKQLVDYDNEIKKQSIPKEVRDGKQAILFGSLENMYQEKGIDVNKETKNDTNYNNIPDIPENVFMGYLSGFLDGEGCIRINKGKRNSYTLTVTVTNSSFDILKLYEEKFGGEIRHKLNECDSKNNYKKVYMWELHNNESLKILKEAYPLTVVKREQIKLAIDFQEWHNQIKIISAPEQKQKAEWYYNRLTELKKEIGDLDENEICTDVEYEQLPDIR